jgi:hypothetical protein
MKGYRTINNKTITTMILETTGYSKTTRIVVIIRTLLPQLLPEHMNMITSNGEASMTTAKINIITKKGIRRTPTNIISGKASI